MPEETGLLVPAVEQGASTAEQRARRLEDLAEHLGRVGLRGDERRCPMQGEHPLVLPLTREEQLCRLERGTELARDALEEPDLLRRPGSRLADLIEHQDARDLASEPDGRGDCGERAAVDQGAVAERRVREARIGPRIAYRDGAPFPHREGAQRQRAVLPDADRFDARRGPLVQHRQAGVAGTAEDHARDRELRAELLESRRDHRVRVEIRIDALRDPVDHRLAVRARIGLRDRKRVVERAGDVLAEERDELELVAGDGIGAGVRQRERADQPGAGHERQQRERSSGRDGGELVGQRRPVGHRLRVVDDEAPPLADQPRAQHRRKGTDRIHDAAVRELRSALLSQHPHRFRRLFVLQERGDHRHRQQALDGGQELRRHFVRRERSRERGGEPADQGELLAAAFGIAEGDLHARGEPPGDGAGADADRDDQKEDLDAVGP